jgi:hypothetical protein
LVSHLGIVEEAVDDGDGEAQFFVDRHMHSAVGRCGEGAGVVPCDVGEHFFVEAELAPLLRKGFRECGAEEIAVQLGDVGGGIESLFLVVQIGGEIKFAAFGFHERDADSASIDLLQNEVRRVLLRRGRCWSWLWARPAV